MFDSITGSVSGIAKSIRGNISDVKGVLSANPHLSPFQYPPMVQQGIPIAEKVLGIKIPTAEDLTNYANGQIDKVIGSLGKDAEALLNVVDANLGSVLKGVGDAQTLLNSINWLI